MQHSTIKRLLTFALFSFTLFFQCTTNTMGMMGGADNFSDEEQAVFDAISNLKPEEMEELANAIQGEIDRMPPEQQEQFMQEVEREAARLQPKIERYQREMTQPIVPPKSELIDPSKKSIVKPVKKEPKVTVSPSKKKEIDSKITATEQYIAQILNAIDKLLGTSQTIPDFAQEVKDWGEDKEINNWKTGMTWSSLASQLEELVRRFHMVKDRDVKTKKYKHLKALIDNTSLYNNLTQLSSRLKQHAPHIEGLSLESTELSPKAESAIKSAIGILVEAIFESNIIEELKKLIAEHMTTAEKLQQERETQRQRALAKSGKPAKPRPTTYLEDLYDTGFTMPPQRSTRGYGRGAAGGMPYRPSTSIRTSPGISRPSQPKKPSAPSKTPAKAKKEEKKEVGEDKTASQHVVTIEDALNSVLVSIEDGKLNKISTQLKRGAGFDMETMTDYLPEANNALRKARTESSKLRHQLRKIKKPDLKKKYVEMYKTAMKEARSLLISTSNEIKKVKKTPPKFKAGDQKQQDALDMLYNIGGKIEELLKMKVN